MPSPSRFTNEEWTIGQVVKMIDVTNLNDGWDLLKNGDLLGANSTLGRSVAGDLGEAIYPEIQLTVTCRKLPRTIKINDFDTYARRHLLSEAPTGLLKTTAIMNYFNNILMAKRSYDEAKSLNSYFYFVPTNTTTAKLRGSFFSGRLIPPVGQLADFLVQSELMNMGIAGEQGRQLIGWMKQASEEGMGGIQLASLNDLEEAMEEVEKWNQAGYNLKLDMHTLTINYDLGFSNVFATRHLTELDPSYFSDDFINRHITKPFIPNEERIIHQFIYGTPPLPDVSLIRKVYQANMILKHCTFETIELPQLSLYKDALEIAVETARDVSQRYGLSLLDLVQMRARRDVILTTMGHAIIHQHKRETAKDKVATFKTIKYDSEDKEFIEKWAPNYVQDLAYTLKTLRQRRAEHEFVVGINERIANYIIGILSSGRRKIGDVKEETARYFGVNEKKVQRTLEALEEKGRIRRYHEGRWDWWVELSDSQ